MAIQAVDGKNESLYSVREAKKEDKIKEAAEEKKEKIKEEKEKSVQEQDEYVKGEESPAKKAGLYQMGKDENGNPKIIYERSAKPEKDEEEKCTGNSDQVDKEIRELKQEKQKLAQEIKNSSEDEDKKADLEKRLSQVESELKLKDNDTYRKQNTSFITE